MASAEQTHAEAQHGARAKLDAGQSNSYTTKIMKCHAKSKRK
jgi:hypothetical protein